MGFFDRFKKKKHQEEELNEQEAVLDENSGETSTESGGAEIGASGYTEAEAPVQPDGGVPAAEEPEQSGNYAAFEAPEAEAEEPLTQPEAIPEPEEAEEPEEIPQAMEAPAPEEETEPEEVPQEEVSEPDFTEDSEEAPKKQGFFEKLKNGLKKTKDGFMSKLELLMNSFTKIDEDFFDELEETLILSDIGAETSMQICDKLRQAVKRTGATDPADVKQLLRGIIAEMLTGDNERTAQAVAAECDIEYVLSGVLPENKAEKVRELQSRGLKLAMVGDGINDAPALAAADTAIAMGGGTDVAIESSDITLLGGRLSAVPDALEVSRATMDAIRLNLAWALLYNVLSVGAAAFGVVNPSMAAAAMSLSSIAVLMNSLRLKKAVEKK